MSQSVAEAAGLVHVTVIHGGRRVDLAVPGAVPVAELLPGLVSAVGALDPYSVHAGYRLVPAGAAALATDSGLTAQGVEAGAVLVIEAGADDRPPRVYDDVVEAMADTVEAQVQPWGPTAARRTALVAGIAALTATAMALGLDRSSGLPVAAAAGTAAVLLVVAAAVLSRVQHADETAVVLTLLAAVFAVVTGLAVLPHEPLLRLPLTLAGVAVVVIGLAGLAALGDHRVALVPALALGGAAAVTGAVLATTSVAPAKAVAVTLVVGVLAGSLLPWLSVTATRMRVPQPRTDGDLLADPQPLDPAEVDRQVRIGHEVLIALTATIGVLVVLTAPLVVRLGPSGPLLGAAASAVLILRTRQYRAETEVLAGMVAGIVGLAVLSAATAWVHPGWRPALAVVLAACGLALVGAALAPWRPSVRLGRLADVAETMALLAMLPLLVLALGIVGAIRS